MAGNEYRIALYTMGCKTNQYDSGRLAEEFLASGFRLVPFNEPADVYVINTCTVTAEADREALRVSRRALARNPEAVVVATGCGVQVDPQPFHAIAGIRLIGGNQLKPELVRRVRDLLATGAAPAADTPIPSPAARPSPKASGVHRTRQVVKVQEGCNYRCAYCVVPYARGKARSRPLAEVLEEVRRHADAGYREIVLTGTCIGSYGNDFTPRVSLAQAAAAIADLPGIERLRISSIEPWEVEDDLIALVATHPVLCPHFHLPLQSGDDGVRRRMHRPGKSDDFAALVARIRTRLPAAGITTDVIVGFPGETEAEFQATYHFCREMRFSRMHVFRYSPRRFTPAAQAPDQVPRAVAGERSRALIGLGEEMAAAFAQEQLGAVHPILVEGAHGPEGLLEGHTPSYLRVRFPGEPSLRGNVVPVRLLEVADGYLLGKVERDG